MSPMSAVSTAPSTPCHDLQLPDGTVPPLSLSSELPMCRFVSTSSIAEEDEDEDTMATPPKPMLQSDLAKWAQRHVEETTYCFGMPRLQSGLGQWAQQMVAAEKWHQEQKLSLAGEDVYLVDNSELQGVTCGLAYRSSKNVEDRFLDIDGPMWGTTVIGSDEGDGWLKVGDFYLPMTLEGMPVLVQDSSFLSEDAHSSSEPVLDGPALTEDGRVVDFDGGAPLFFASDPTLSSGHACKIVMINVHKGLRNVRSALDNASAAAEVDAEGVCSLDADGNLRGEKSYSWSSAYVTKEMSDAAKKRLKLFHQKRKRRQQGKGPRFEDVVGIDPNGTAFLLLDLPDPIAQLKKKIRRKAACPSEMTACEILTMDCNGVVQFP